MEKEKGEWIIMGEYIKCNKCERLIKTESPDSYFYCPQCGQKMIEKEEIYEIDDDDDDEEEEFY